MYAWFRVWAALLVLAVHAFTTVGFATDRWASLRENNPFAPHEPPAPVVEAAPPQLELRGVMVEGRVTWFNVYNAETKESAWVKRGDQLADFVIKDYEAERETLVLDYRQRAVSVALKPLKMKISNGSGRRGVAVASAAVPAGSNPTLLDSGRAPAESQRLERVAEQIRQRREARRRLSGQGSRT